MPRKRKTDQSIPTEPTNEASAPATEGAVAVVDEPVILPIAEPPVILPMAEAPVIETKPEPGFAERVGQKQVTAPDPYGIATDRLAGVRLFESREDRQVAIKFGDGSLETKPSQAVLDRMKEAGFRWNPKFRVWTHPVRPESALATRIQAEQLYQEVRDMIRKEKGIEPERTQDTPF